MGINLHAWTDPWSDGSAKLELAIYYGEPNRISRLKISGGVTSDLGSGQFRMILKWQAASNKPQASSLTAGPGDDRIDFRKE
jgi:hypothetical protein